MPRFPPPPYSPPNLYNRLVEDHSSEKTASAGAIRPLLQLERQCPPAPRDSPGAVNDFRMLASTEPPAAGPAPHAVRRPDVSTHPVLVRSSAPGKEVMSWTGTQHGDPPLTGGDPGALGRNCCDMLNMWQWVDGDHVSTIATSDANTAPQSPGNGGGSAIVGAFPSDVEHTRILPDQPAVFPGPGVPSIVGNGLTDGVFQPTLSALCQSLSSTMSQEQGATSPVHVWETCGQPPRRGAQRAKLDQEVCALMDQAQKLKHDVNALTGQTISPLVTNDNMAFGGTDTSVVAGVTRPPTLRRLENRGLPRREHPTVAVSRSLDDAPAAPSVTTGITPLLRASAPEWQPPPHLRTASPPVLEAAGQEHAETDIHRDRCPANVREGQVPLGHLRDTYRGVSVQGYPLTDDSCLGRLRHPCGFAQMQNPSARQVRPPGPNFGPLVTLECPTNDGAAARPDPFSPVREVCEQEKTDQDCANEPRTAAQTTDERRDSGGEQEELQTQEASDALFHSVVASIAGPSRNRHIVDATGTARPVLSRKKKHRQRNNRAPSDDDVLSSGGDGTEPSRARSKTEVQPDPSPQATSLVWETVELPANMRVKNTFLDPEESDSAQEESRQRKVVSAPAVGDCRRGTDPGEEVSPTVTVGEGPDDERTPPHLASSSCSVARGNILVISWWGAAIISWWGAAIISWWRLHREMTVAHNPFLRHRTLFQMFCRLLHGAVYVTASGLRTPSSR